jgi:hypothetical protein
MVVGAGLKGRDSLGELLNMDGMVFQAEAEVG